MKPLFITIFVLILSCLAFGQSQNGEKWVVFEPSVEEFSVEVPVIGATDRLKDSSGAEQKGDGSSYRIITAGTYFYIFSDAFSASEPYLTNRALKFARAFKATESSLAVGNFKGKKFEFADDDGFYYTFLTVETKRRSYVFQTVSETENSPLVERFFASIRLDRKPSDPPKTAPPKTKKDASSSGGVPQKAQDKDKNVGGGKEIPPAGGAVNAGASSDSPPNSRVTPLKILSKPSPFYTDYARLCEITGTVSLRVIFLASGEIGSITPVRKLPFGLTGQAIKAARGIKFVPANKEGQPFSVSKLVEFSFTY